jgi:elongation factor 1-beta
MATVDLKKLNNDLASRSYLEGYRASQADVAVFIAVARLTGGAVDATAHPHVSRWFNHIKTFDHDSLPGDKVVVPAVAAAAAPAPAPAAAAPAPKKAADADDGFDFSDDSDDDEPFALNDDPEYLKKVQAAKDKAAAKEKKSKSHVVIEVKPYEAETDLKVLAEQCKKALTPMAGFEWLGAQFVDVAYGLQKILISFYAVNSLCNVDEINELIEEFEDVQSVDIRSFTNA